MSQLPPGTIVAAHHTWSLGEIRRILDRPGKRFRIAWYAEANVGSTDDPAPSDMPVAERIAEAKEKQEALAETYGRERFANLIELDGERDKKDGELSGPGNSPADWLKDANAAKSAGFGYIAKSPSAGQVRELRAKLGEDFVARIVYEDVSAEPGAENPGYRRDAKALAERGERLTLVIHEGAYGEFPGTSLEKARAILEDFKQPTVEAYWGRPNGFSKLQSFADERMSRLGRDKE